MPNRSGRPTAVANENGSVGNFKLTGKEYNNNLVSAACSAQLLFDFLISQSSIPPFSKKKFSTTFFYTSFFWKIYSLHQFSIPPFYRFYSLQFSIPPFPPKNILHHFTIPPFSQKYILSTFSRFVFSPMFIQPLHTRHCTSRSPQQYTRQVWSLSRLSRYWTYSDSCN